ncbi:MAG: hypothetical protein ACK4GQ_01655 [Candidatus Hadarchaeales archaeon]
MRGTAPTPSIRSQLLLKRAGHLRTNQFCRKFYGYIDRSNRGKYTYKRPGFLDGIPHIPVIRGVVIVKTEDADEVVHFLKRFRAEVHSWTVLLRPEDEKVFVARKGARPPDGSLRR